MVRYLRSLTAAISTACWIAAVAGAQPQSNVKKVAPQSKGSVNVRELERNEKARGITPKEKKVENENQILPPPLPVPPNAKGTTFRVPAPAPAPEKKSPNSTGGFGKTNGPEGAQPDFPALDGGGFTVIPPDLGGAIGPNHAVTALNSQVRIQDKTGTTISTFTLNGFISTVGGVSGANAFDPKVLYDRFAGRWMFVAPANSNSGSSSLVIAVSANSDPTGTWTGYSFDVDSANTKWFDYPSFGFNTNWIVVTGNLYNVDTSPMPSFSFQGEQVYMFDKAGLYAGTSTAPSVSNRPTSEGFTICPAITQDNTQATEYLVSRWNASSGGNGYLRIYTITGTPSAPSFAMTSLLPNVASPWASSNGGADFAPQSTVTQKIQNNDDRMQNVVYQGGSLWCAHTAFLPAGATPNHTAAQWWQIDPTSATVQQFGRVEDTATPSFYAFPSIAVNAYNDVLLGYSSFSGSQFASSNYSFRLHTDAANTLQATVPFRAGAAKYVKIGGGRNRWGDYSSTVMDPDGFSLWSLQEYAETPTSGVDRWGTEWTRVVPPVPSLFVQDRVDDAGAEPNASSQPMYESTDIWLRKTQDSAHAFAHVTEDAEYRTGTSNPNYVYVEVRNRGGAPSAGTEQLTVYWAKASSGLSWPSPWTGGVYFDPGPNTMLMGDVIGTATIPAIAANGNAILEFAWNPPDPAVYTGALAPDQHHFCLLARVTTSTTSPFGMTFLETGNLYANVQNNNKVAWKNIQVFDMVGGTGAPAYAMIANLTGAPMKAHVRFDGLDADGNAALFEHGTLLITPDAKLRARLPHVAGDGIRQQADGTIAILKPGAMLRDITLAPNEFATMEVKFVPTAGAQQQKGYVVRVEQLADAAGHDQLVGGLTFLTGAVKGFNEKQPTGTKGGGGGPGPRPAQRLPWIWIVIIIIVIGVIVIIIIIVRRR